MTTVIERLDLGEYEAEHGQSEVRDREDERVLSDDEIAHMLLDAAEMERLEGLQQTAVAFDAADDRDGLSAMRGVMIGLAWVTPIWLLIAAFFALT